MSIRPPVLLFAVAVCLLPSLASAQNQRAGQASPPAGTNVALLDVSYVFKNHVGFKSRAELIKKEVKDYDGRIAEQKKSLTEKREGLKQFRPGSPEYEKTEGDIAREVANLDVDARIKRNEILEKEAKLYYETYMHVNKVVATFCQRHNIGLVLRYDSEQIDPEDRASVFRGVNRAVIFQQDIDITQDILAIINADTAQPAAAKTVSRPSPGGGRVPQ